MAAALEVEFENEGLWLYATRASPANTQDPLLQIIAVYFFFALRPSDCVENSSPANFVSECEECELLEQRQSD
jgi:hypothetical protein